MPFSIVCISPQIWHAELPTNRQQIMARAARRGHEVLFLESGSFLGRGLRGFSRHPMRELRARLAGEAVADRIVVRSALNLLPWGKRFEVSRSANVWATARLVRRLADRMPSPVVLWLYDPTAYSVIGRVGEALAVYDCVDDYAQQYAPDPRRIALVADSDRQAGARARLVFATTEELAARHRRWNPCTFLVPNGADYDHFAAGSDEALAAAETQGIPRPRLGFIGNLTPEKVDFGLLHALADRRRDWSLILVGPLRERARKPFSALAACPNVHWLGYRRYEELPRYVAALDVGLCPYVTNAYTRNVFPLKVYEYLAAGKPVVATGTPTLAGMGPDVLLADGLEETERAVELALTRASPRDRERRMGLAAKNTWEYRTEQLLALITRELERARAEPLRRSERPEDG